MISQIKSKNLFYSALLLLFPIIIQGQDFRYAPENKGVLVTNTYYCLDYSTEHKQANWVYYMLTQTHITGSASRAFSFKDCRQGDIFSATNKDYNRSGYDKGHLCPAADMKLSKVAMKETFQMWNMSPQVPSFNRGKWADLEALVRSYIKDLTDTLFVVTGPVFINNQGTIGKGEVTVPGFYYKAIYFPKKGGIGFLLPNKKIDGTLQGWQVSIELLEALTGIDFFPQLPKDIQAKIESQIIWWE